MSEYVNDLLVEKLAMLDAARANSLTAMAFHKSSLEDVLLRRLLGLVTKLQAVQDEKA
jgi:hypothetical protein